MVKELKIILNGPPNQAYTPYTPGSEVSGRLVVEVDGQPKSYHYIQVYANVALVLWSKEQSLDQKLHPAWPLQFPFSVPAATGTSVFLPG